MVRACATALPLVLLLGGTAPAEIVHVWHTGTETMDLTKAGTLDWCVYRITHGKRDYALGDAKKGGAGIARRIDVRGKVKKDERTRYTGVGWGWTDGAKRARHVHRQGSDDGMGLRVWLPAQAALIFEFAPPPAGQQRQAHLILRCDGKVDIVARQGKTAKTVAAIRKKWFGVAIVRYDGAEPLTVEVVNPDRSTQTVRGFAAALSGPVDYEDGRPPHLLTRQDVVAKKAATLGPIDFVKVATDYADCMIRYGRDRYGEVRSPLFAVLLLREKEPRVGPQPRFDDPDRTGTYPVFNRFKFNRCLNYPDGLGAEGPHKVTLTGCDPYEDRALYTMLIDLSRITNNSVYKVEALRALNWWFTHTQGPAGLYPWGEHLGWDFEHECPTYFEGPSRHLFAACYHEIKDDVPFLDVLAALPDSSRLERYALGVWEAHYWDKSRAYYCRHGDYTGKDDREGSPRGFPAHQAAHFRLWTEALLKTRKPDVRRQLVHILDTVADAQLERAEKYGFIPYNFDPELDDEKPRSTGQSTRLARAAAEVSARLKEAAPETARKLAALARKLMGRRGMTAYLASLDRDIPKDAEPPEARVRDLSNSVTPGPHARAVLELLKWHKHTGDDAYLRAAERQARLAYVRFMDDVCPLPKAYETPRRTREGKRFPDFYFRGASLMHAFALLGEQLRK